MPFDSGNYPEYILSAKVFHKGRGALSASQPTCFAGELDFLLGILLRLAYISTNADSF